MYNDSGKESEWNEATFKSKRLNDIQEMINFFKTDPLGITNGKFNYEWLAKNVECLYVEGRSKYSEKQKKEMDGIKILVDKTLKYMCPHSVINKTSFAGDSKTYSFNQTNFDMLMNILYTFEMKARDYNDEHGLTTKNKGTSGMF